MFDQFYTIRFHHGGTLSDSDFTYVGGNVHFEENVDPDLMSYFEILGSVKEMKYPVNTVVWYKLPKKNELKIIGDDVGVMEMFKIFAAAKVYEVDMFIDTVDIEASLSVLSSYEVDNNALGVRNDMGVEIDLGVQTELGVSNNLGTNLDFGEETDSDPSYDANIDCDDSDTDDDSMSDFEYFAEGDTLSDSEYPLENNIAATHRVIDGVSNNEPAFNTGEKEIQSNPEFLSEPSDSDDEYMGEKFPEFNEGTDLIDPKHEVGLVFANSAVYRKALRQFSVKKGFELTVEKK
ncbi:PREDICTED: uncharacterized protein LOC105964485 [Erythranthe guttata]|uniref:uncharacterized protein LOC105964485 n=1 Tax=Erythranthe guttata TaxID=4155 RepID=UPI00064DDE53|nr:PREDICTED: uncharacterized protein LOC105964485 [Erythranthe guttata]|eukprot:XP_012844445.1 PREDICTED: uncharacterized protein LOC105964485 [Erythranthe guttata]